MMPRLIFVAIEHGLRLVQRDDGVYDVEAFMPSSVPEGTGTWYSARDWPDPWTVGVTKDRALAWAAALAGKELG